MTDSYDLLNPPDIALTLRSLPRRVRQALAAGDRPSETVAALPGPAGRSPIDLMTALEAAVVTLDRALEQALLHDDPVVTTLVTDSGTAPTSTDPTRSLAQTLAALDAAAGRSAERIDSTPGDGWSRPAHSEQGAPVTALVIARQSARVSITALHELEALIETLGRPEPG